MAGLWKELRRRNVVRVGIAYLIVGWLLLEVSSVLGPALKLPEWTGSFVAFFLILGLPVALIFAWAFELTPDGIKRDKDVDRSKSITARTGRKLDFTIIGLMAVAILFLVLDNYLVDDSDDSDDAETQVSVSQPIPGFSNRAAIAVLPFINISQDKSQEYFSDGITEDLITGLQMVRRFPVIAKTSTFSYKADRPDVREIARSLGAGYILEGSVRREDDRVRITAQLSDGEGRHFWAESYDSELADVFAVQDEITRQIIGAIEPELLRIEIDRSANVRTEDMQAWDYYLRATAVAPTYGGYVTRSGEPVTLEGMEAAIDLTEKALELDPSFADAYSLLGHLHTIYAMWTRGKEPDEEVDNRMRLGFDYLAQGRDLSPFSASNCSCYVWYLTGGALPEFMDLDAALEIQETAVELNPANPVGRATLAMVYQSFGRLDEALKQVEIAKRLSPRDVDYAFFLTVDGMTHLLLGDWEKAASTSYSAIVREPTNFDSHAIRIVALYAQNDMAAATKAKKHLYDLLPDFEAEMISDFPQPGALVPLSERLLGDQENPRFQHLVAAILGELEE